MTEHNFDQMRRAMVASQLRTTGVSNPRVLAAMGAVPRERFVPDGRVAVAYADALVPLGNGRTLNSPMAIGRLLSQAAPEEGERVLVVGAATGYSAALLARLAGAVAAVEEDVALAATARAMLADTGIQLVEAPLAAGYAEGGPYDLILVDGAVEQVPQALIDQLRDGGRLATGLIDQGVGRLALGRKSGHAFGLAVFSDCAVAVLPGFARPRTFSFS